MTVLSVVRLALEGVALLARVHSTHTMVNRNREKGTVTQTEMRSNDEHKRRRARARARGGGGGDTCSVLDN